MKKSANNQGKGETEGGRELEAALIYWQIGMLLHVCIYVACGIAIKVEIQQSKQARKINDCNDC